MILSLHWAFFDLILSLSLSLILFQIFPPDPITEDVTDPVSYPVPDSVPDFILDPCTIPDMSLINHVPIILSLILSL